MVKEGWLMPSLHRATITIAVMLLFIVVAAKAAFSDWSSAWTVGTVFIGMVALAMKVPNTS
jgi:hypothetical protein